MPQHKLVPSTLLGSLLVAMVRWLLVDQLSSTNATAVVSTTFTIEAGLPSVILFSWIFFHVVAPDQVLDNLPMVSQPELVLVLLHSKYTSLRTPSSLLPLGLS